MPQPTTVVTLIDEDGDEFPIRLPGVYRSNRGADIEAAMQILGDDPALQPRGTVTARDIEYLNEVTA
jgi:hypothetical protein